jgi:hypothetical protein
MYTALLASSRDEMLERRIGNGKHPRLWPNSVPIMRIHALKEPEIAAALGAMDAKTRILGSHPMLPVVMDFNNVPSDLINLEPRPTRSMRTVEISDSIGNFSLAA